MSEQGHSVTLAVDGKQGIEFFKKGAYDLVLTNLSMPEMSGWEVVREIKSADPYVKVALMTGCGTHTKEEEAKAKGVDFLISKPFKKNQLLFAVSEAIKKNKNFLPEGNLTCKKS